MILDLGSKAGKTLDNIKRELQDLDLVAVDIRKHLLKNVVGKKVVADIRLPFVKPKSVDYVSICNVLEHMDNLDEVKAVVGHAVTYAKKMVYILTPWFDDDEYLASFGLNFYWSTWPDHKTHLTTRQLKSILDELNVKYSVYGDEIITDSLSPRLHPVGYEAGHNYTRGDYPPKRFVRFNHPLYNWLICKVYP